MPFRPEPPYEHGSAPRTAILLCNLGTPDAPTPGSVRKYLAEFLSDPRVVEIPSAIWKPILYGIILRTRPAKSARKYASIWTDQGSPLRLWTDKQAEGLAATMAGRGRPVLVRAAMRYGQPSIAAALDALKADGATRVLILPLYPQYAGPTSASVFDAVYAWASNARAVPELRFVNRYHDHGGYIDALATRVREHWVREGVGERLVLSFHGVPERTLSLGDPYHCECLKTARLLRETLDLPASQMLVTFQSRFGKAKWLQPYTEPTLRRLAAEGVRRVDVMCPGFTADCLETLEEIGDEAREAFLTSGGESFHYIACLNDQPAWIEALADIAGSHLLGWGDVDPAASAQARAAQREAALALGAVR